MDFNFFKRKQPLGARQSQRAALAARLVDAEQAVAEGQRAATEAALEGRDDTALDRAEAHTRAAAHRVSVEALSFELMRKQLAPLELRPVLCPIFGANAPELRKPRTERSIPKFKRLLDEISKRQRRSR